MPTSIIICPEITCSAVIKCDLPTATMTISADRVSLITSIVLLWTTDITAPLFERSCAIGLPTSCERPTTVIFLPLISIL